MDSEGPARDPPNTRKGGPMRVGLLKDELESRRRRFDAGNDAPRWVRLLSESVGPKFA